MLQGRPDSQENPKASTTRMRIQIAVAVLLSALLVVTAQGGQQVRGGSQPNRRQGRFLSRLFPNGVPQNIQELLNQGTPEARRQAWELIRQARQQRFGNGSALTQEQRLQRRNQFLAQVYPDGVPQNVQELLNQGTPEALRQAWQLVRQARRERFPNRPGGRVGSRLTAEQRRQRRDQFLARVYPDGVPQNIRDLFSQGTWEATRQAWQLVRQAAEARGISPRGGRGPRRNRGSGN